MKRSGSLLYLPVALFKKIKIQFDKDLLSKHKDLFLRARTLSFLFEGIEETKKKELPLIPIKKEVFVI